MSTFLLAPCSVFPEQFFRGTVGVMRFRLLKYMCRI